MLHVSTRPNTVTYRPSSWDMNFQLLEHNFLLDSTINLKQKFLVSLQYFSSTI